MQLSNLTKKKKYDKTVKKNILCPSLQLFELGTEIKAIW